MKAKKAISSPKDELTKAAGIYCLQTKKLMILATHLTVQIRPAVNLDRHLTSNSSKFFEIDRSKGNANSLLHLSSHDSPGHLSPNVSTSGRIFGSAEVGHTTMGTLRGL